MLDDVQAEPIDKLPVDDPWIRVPAEVGDVRVPIIRTRAHAEPPAIVFMHGGGRVLGNVDTHDRLVRACRQFSSRPWTLTVVRPQSQRTLNFSR